MHPTTSPCLPFKAKANAACSNVRQCKLTVRGQIIHLCRDMNSARYHDETTVSIRPPLNPSQVFLGDSLISGVLPKKKPARLSVSFSGREAQVQAKVPLVRK